VYRLYNASLKSPLACVRASVCTRRTRQFVPGARPPHLSASALVCCRVDLCCLYLKQPYVAGLIRSRTAQRAHKVGRVHWRTQRRQRVNNRLSHIISSPAAAMLSCHFCVRPSVRTSFTRHRRCGIVVFDNLYSPSHGSKQQS